MKTIILFDVDGTLTPSRLTVKPEMLNTLNKLKQIDNLDIGIVGGSDLDKQKEQLGEDNLALFDYVFSENGLYASHQGKLLKKLAFVIIWVKKN